MDNLEAIVRDAEALPNDLRATARDCGDDLELQLKLSLHWMAARKLAASVRALAEPARPAGPPVLRVVR